MGNVYDGDATALSRESDANRLQAIERRLRKVGDMVNTGIANIVQQDYLI